jgi:hypothetical protein
MTIWGMKWKSQSADYFMLNNQVCEEIVPNCVSQGTLKVVWYQCSSV